MTARRLQHGSVPCPPALLDAVEAFYRDAVGLRPIPNLAGVRWFELPNGDHLHVLDGPALADSRAHLAFEVDDLDDTLRRCRAHGCEPAEQPALWGAARWFVRDPAGNLVELFDVSPPLLAERE
jgi:catechol 2,3-dioxygenase-like lactoylglutathione lyase family enzyme